MGFKHFFVYLLIVNSIAVHAQKARLKFQNGNFKIVQFTDVHLKAKDSGSQVSIETIEKVLDLERPDLVVFTGDIVVGKPVIEGWEMVLTPCIKRHVPYAVVFGNHDDEVGFSRQVLSNTISKMPYSLLFPKIEGVYGFGNYVLEVHSSDDQKIEALLYCIDSNTYTLNSDYKGYGWIMHSQIEWYKEQSKAYAATNGNLPAVAFFHIPLPEYKEAYFHSGYVNIGIRKENECSPKFNSGMFDAMVERGDVMATFVGHDHDNDYIAYKKGIALAYGRFTGSSTTYGKLHCGSRVIQLNEGERSFTTWVRTGKGEKLNMANYPEDFISTFLVKE